MKSSVYFLLFWIGFSSSSGLTQSLINIDFGVGSVSGKSGFAATGQSTNDFWNLHSHYKPRYSPDMPLAPNGRSDALKFSDGTPSRVSILVSNAPGVWGNTTGDPMLDQYIFSQNGSNIVVSINGLNPGQYQFYLFGHADPDVIPEQNSFFTLSNGTQTLGPLSATSPSTQSKRLLSTPDQPPYVLFRDVEVLSTQPITIQVSAGPHGVPVLNGMQIRSHGTGPPKLSEKVISTTVDGKTNLLFREIRYRGRVSGNELTFQVTLEVESMSTNAISSMLFEGDLALVPAEIPSSLRLEKQGRRIELLATSPGAWTLSFDLIPRIEREEPWNRIRLTGPPAAIASVYLESTDPETELKLLQGTRIEKSAKNKGELSGFLAADRVLALAWQGKTKEVERTALTTVDSTVSFHLTPSVMRCQSAFSYEILQAPLSKLLLTLPKNQTLNRLKGEWIRDWELRPMEDQSQQLKIEFLRPVEKTYSLTLFTESVVKEGWIPLESPIPLGVRREAGVLEIEGEQVQLELRSAPHLRQINALSGNLAAYRFQSRPLGLECQIRPVEPQLTMSDRVACRLEESRLLVNHVMTVQVEKAGVYALDFELPGGYTINQIQVEGLEDSQSSDNHLHLNFHSRLLGSRTITLSLEKAFDTLPDRISMASISMAQAIKSSSRVGVSTSTGLRVKTSALSNLREIPVRQLPDRTDELLAFTGDQTSWELTLLTERLPGRTVAEVFNLVTVGDGRVGGSAVVRYSILNQGLSQLHVQLPAHWKNIEFTGPNIRRTEVDTPANPNTNANTATWTLALQEKVWGNYTLVISYDYPFDPTQAQLDSRGAHALGVERETGSIAIAATTALKLDPVQVTEPLQRIDPSELSDLDRALVTRPVLLAYRYLSGTPHELRLNISRHPEIPVLDAIADRTQLATVLTESGEMLTQASFMVKNNDRQFQKFRLPADATLWGCEVNGDPVKAERDGDWVMISLPRRVNRDEAFAVGLKYAQRLGSLPNWFPQTVRLVAPKTDLPSTYAEWQLYVPQTRHLSHFGGNMVVARGTEYGFKDGWEAFLQIYEELWAQCGKTVVVGGGCLLMTGMLIYAAMRRGTRGLVAALCVVMGLAILVGMMLPALAKAKSRASRISSVNNLKQIALAARIYANDHSNHFPATLEAMLPEVGVERVFNDPENGKRYVYIGAEKDINDPNAILAFSPVDDGRGRNVAFADGSVHILSTSDFAAVILRDRGAPPGLVAEILAGAKTGSAGTVNLPTPIASSAQNQPWLAGLRSIKIELPRTGKSFDFTKVLNLEGEPLELKVDVMKTSTWGFKRMTLQLLAFIVGLTVAGREWRQADPRAMRITLGLSLAIGSTLSLLIALRALHLLLCLLAPSLALIAGLRLFRWWRATHPRPKTSSGNDGITDAIPVSPTLLIPIALWIGVAHGTAQNLVANGGSGRTLAPVSLVQASYDGMITPAIAQITSTLEFRCNETNQSILLWNDDLAIESTRIVEGSARLFREGQEVGLLLQSQGRVIVETKLVARVSGDVDRKKLSFRIPNALVSRVSLHIEEPDLQIDFPTAVSFVSRTSANGKSTTISGMIGADPRVDLNWAPSLKRTGGIAATVFVRNHASVTLTGGAIRILSKIEYQVSQGNLPRLHLHIPLGDRVLKVEGKAIQSWELNADSTLLTIDLLKGVDSEYLLTLETEHVLGSLPASVLLEIPHALEVKRENGDLAVYAQEEHSVKLTPLHLERVDLQDLTRTHFPNIHLNLIGAYRFQDPTFELRAQVEPTQPAIEAALRHEFQLGLDEVHLKVRAQYEVQRAGVFLITLDLPPRMRLESVTGDRPLQWQEKTQGETRQLEVLFPQRLLGTLTLQLEMSALSPSTTSTLSLTGIRPQIGTKSSGSVTLFTEPGLAIKSVKTTGLMEVPARSLKDVAEASHPNGLLAFKTGTSPQWEIQIGTERVASWIRAEAITTATITESLLTGHTWIKYDIANAPVQELRVRIPSACQNIEIMGENIRRRDQNGEEWRIELQGAVSGEYRLHVSWECARPAASRGTNVILTIPSIAAQGAERETGYVLLMTPSNMQLAATRVSEDLLRMDANELPAWVSETEKHASGSLSPVLVYRYLRPGWQLAVSAMRFDEATVLQALLDEAILRTVVADDGQVMTRMTLQVRNNGRQYLEVTLPSSSQLWSAFVDGEPIRPGNREGRLLLPLDQGNVEEATTRLEVVYVNREKFPKTKGLVSLESPQFDIPLKNAKWELHLPPDFDYSEFRGTMTPDGRDVALVAMDFTLGEYGRQESRYREEQKSTTPSTQNKTRHPPSQSLGPKSGSVPASLEPPTDPGHRDLADKQWEVLQRSQEVAARQVQPLRITLPTRGRVHAFTQVLLTQAHKPMTIQFLAKNQREGKASIGIGIAVVGFLTLWLAIKRAVRSRQ